MAFVFGVIPMMLLAPIVVPIMMIQTLLTDPAMFVEMMKYAFGPTFELFGNIPNLLNEALRFVGEILSMLH